MFAFNSLDCKNTHLALCIVMVNLCINGTNFSKNTIKLYLNYCFLI